MSRYDGGCTKAQLRKLWLETTSVCYITKPLTHSSGRGSNPRPTNLLSSGIKEN